MKLELDIDEAMKEEARREYRKWRMTRTNEILFDGRAYTIMLLWKENKEKLIRERNIEKLLDIQVGYFAAKLIREEAEVHPPRAELRRRQKEKEQKASDNMDNYIVELGEILTDYMVTDYALMKEVILLIYKEHEMVSSGYKFPAPSVSSHVYED